jgi:beta-phosphoglucomutase
LDDFIRTTTGKKNREILHYVLGTELSETDLAYWGERKENLYRERFAACREPMPGLLPLLEQAHTFGLPMAVATSAPPDNIPFILDELDLRRHFQAVIGSDQIQQGKPDPEIFLKAAQALGVEPADCLVFEDALAGIEAARRAGMEAVFLCTTHEAEEVSGIPHILSAVPDFTQIDLTALPGQAG